MAKQDFISPWKVLAKRWETLYTPPGRPSQEAVRFYKKFAKDATRGLRRRPRGLVLGATPELRDLLTEMKWEAVMIDANMEMIEAMAALLKRSNPDEIIVKGDWIKNPLKTGYFDVVFGDLVLANVPWNLQSALLKNVRRMLKPGGAFITKVEIGIENKHGNRQADADALLEMYARMPRYRNKAMELFCYLLHAVAWDRRVHLADTQRMKRWMAKYQKGGRYVHKSKEAQRLLNLIWRMWEPMVKVWGVGTDRELRTRVARHFTVLDSQILSDCREQIVRESFPLWYLKAKQ